MIDLEELLYIHDIASLPISMTFFTVVFDMPQTNFKSIKFIPKFIEQRNFRFYCMPGTVPGNRNIAVTHETIPSLLSFISPGGGVITQ